MKRISYVLDAFDLLEQLVGLELLGKQFQLILGIEELFFGFVQFVLQFSVFAGVQVNLVFEAQLGHWVSLGLRFSILDLHLDIIAGRVRFLQKIFKFLLKLLNHKVFFKDSLDKYLFLFICLIQRLLKQLLTSLKTSNLQFFLLKNLFDPLYIQLQILELFGRIFNNLSVDGFQFFTEYRKVYIFLLASLSQYDLVTCAFQSRIREAGMMGLILSFFWEWPLRGVWTVPTLQLNLFLSLRMVDIVRQYQNNILYKPQIHGYQANIVYCFKDQIGHP